MSAEERLKELGYTLPVPPTPVASYVPVVRTGKLCFVSGQLPAYDKGRMVTGTVPEDCSVEKATEAARICAFNILAQLKAHLTSLDKVTQIVHVAVYVRSSVGFGEHPRIANGASNLFVEIFGDNIGKHSRVALGAAELPLGASVEISAIVEVAPLE